MTDLTNLKPGDKVVCLLDVRSQEMEVHHTFTDGHTTYAVVTWRNHFGQSQFLVITSSQVLRRVENGN